MPERRSAGGAPLRIGEDALEVLGCFNLMNGNRTVLPAFAEVRSMTFRELIDMLAAVDPARLAKANPIDLLEAPWVLIDENLRGGFIKHCRELTDDRLRHCAEIAETFFSWLVPYGGYSRQSATGDRFHLSATLILAIGPRTDIALLDPMRLLHEFLHDSPPVETARELLAGPSPGPEARAIVGRLSLLEQLRRIDHLLPPSAEKGRYEQWKTL
ncbi:hypothetical protein SAMN04489729_7227 [Amycolatopsis lurida]|uniref:Uncharacterized protein n=1 Tax=Amycolatopsis lurida NRRL 2430 TaxID=1460371 RepID=A0A2P2FJD6_AMYLU|nr:hypothetical protein [Amycolatopsis lurida]KFU76840.1 hypothetical protein BB31_34230 [Amycolatopsis lurida NRRL 2430]SEE35983.1 hypothetical protein SAMN04489729_7227 [Amycolatopsis lurida]